MSPLLRKYKLTYDFYIVITSFILFSLNNSIQHNIVSQPKRQFDVWFYVATFIIGHNWKFWFWIATPLKSKWGKFVTQKNIIPVFLPNNNHFLVFVDPLLKYIDNNLQWIDRSKGAWQTGHRTSQESSRRCKCRSTAQQCEKLCVLFHLKLLVLFKLNCNYRCL